MTIVVAILFTAIACATISRNLIWRDNIALFEDAIAKSPEFPFARSVLADLLIEVGRVEEGRVLIRSTTAPKGLRNADFLDLKRAKLLFDEGKYDAAKQLILVKRSKEGQLYYSFQKLLAKVNHASLSKLSGQEWEKAFNDTIELHLELYQVTRDPFYYYMLGRIYMQAGNQERAAHYFQLASEQSPAGTHYKAAATSLAKSLLKP